MANINLTPGERYTFGKLKGVSVITDSTDNAETPKYIRNKLYVTASAAELNVAGVNALVKVSTTSVNDPMLQFSIGTFSYENWTIGIDNNDSGSFKIQNAQTLGSPATLALRIDTNENISIPGAVAITGSFALGGIANTVTANTLYYNPTTKQVTYGASGSGGGGGGTPGGSDTQIQYNNAGVFGGVSALTWDGTTLRATGSFSGSLTGIATSGSSILVSNTPSTAGTYYPVFVNGVSGYRSALVDNSTFTYDTTTNTLNVTASYATNALTASIATTALTASYTFTTLSSSYAVNSNNTNNINITDNPAFGGVTYYPTFVGQTTGYTNVLVDSSVFTYNPNTNVLTTTASYALSASYAANGGVTQLLAGPNVTLSPTNGLGQVTISSTGGGGGTGNTATGSYGSFYDTTIQTNVAGTARSMSLNTTDITNGVSISGSTNPFNTYIKVANAGVYDIQFSAQVDKTDSGTDEIWIWIRKNGTDISDSATSVQLVGNGAHYVAAWNFFVNAAANDYFQLMWYSPDANVRLHAESAFGVVPGIPSLIVTANRVDQFLSNTGSFSGSFIGAFTGSFSGSGTITSASYAATASLAPLYLPLAGGTITGNVTVLGTASINTLIVNQIGYSSGSNQLGDAANDTQTLYGTVRIPTGSLTVTGSTRITGSLTVAGQVSSNDVFVSTAIYPIAQGFSTSGSAIGPVGFHTNVWRGTYTGNSFSYVSNAYTSSATNTALAITRPSTPTFAQFILYVKADNTSVMDMGGGAPILDIASNGTSYSRFDGTNFSIGTTSALSRLHVRGSGTTSATTALLVENANASASLMVRDDGRVGIGTNSPSYTLDVAGAVYFASPVHIGSVLPALSTASGTLYFAGSKMAIFNTGNVIIQNGGTFTDVGYRLDVQGTTRINGNTNITGSLTVTGGITGSITTAATASKIISNGSLNGGNHYFYISTYPPAGGNVGVIQTSNLVYNSSTNTLPTTSSWATSSISSSYVNTLVQSVVITGSLNVTAGITGSLLGTASYATQALSASWAPGGGGSSFPFTGSAQITGSLSVTGDINVTGYSGFGTNTPTVRLEVNSGDNSLTRALKVRNTDSGSTAAAVMDFKTTDNDEFSIGQFNGAFGGVFNAGDVFLQNGSTTGGLSNMYIGNAGNANRMVISHTNTVGIGFPIGSVSSTMFSVSGSADIINNLSVGSNGGSLLLENGAGITGEDVAGNIILNFDGATNPTLLMGPDSGINLLVTNTNGGITEIIDQDTLEVDYVGSQSAQGSILSRATSGEAFTTGQLLFLSSSNQWYIADADAAATSTPLLGIALKDAGAANDLIAVLLEGHYSTDAYHDQVATPATPGSPLYISTTAGNVTETAPTGTGDVVRLIGHNIYGGAGGRGPDVAVIRFKPDNTWIEL